MKRMVLIGWILMMTLSAGVSAQRRQPPAFWQGCVTVQNATEWEKAYVVVFDQLTVLEPGTAATICDKR